MALIYGNSNNVNFGVPEGLDPKTLTYEGFPAGSKVRLRLRPDDFAQAFVRTYGKCLWYYVTIQDGVCRPTLAKGMNLVVTVEKAAAPKPRRVIRRLEPVD